MIIKETFGSPRVIRIKDELNTNKYVKQSEYEGFSIYQKYTPTGWREHGEFAIACNDKDNFAYVIVFPSFNDYSKDDLYDMIDNYNQCGKFGVKAWKLRNDYDNTNYYYVHHHRGTINI